MCNAACSNRSRRRPMPMRWLSASTRCRRRRARPACRWCSCSMSARATWRPSRLAGRCIRACRWPRATTASARPRRMPSCAPAWTKCCRSAAWKAWCCAGMPPSSAWIPPRAARRRMVTTWCWRRTRIPRTTRRTPMPGRSVPTTTPRCRPSAVSASASARCLPARSRSPPWRRVQPIGTGRRAPQWRQCRASGSWPSRPHSGQPRRSRWPRSCEASRRLLASSAV